MSIVSFGQTDTFTVDGEFYLKVIPGSGVTLPDYDASYVGTYPHFQNLITTFGITSIFKPFKNLNPDLDNVYRISFTDNAARGTLADSLQSYGFVLGTECLYKMRIMSSSPANDSLLHNQDNLVRSGFIDAWSTSKGDGILVAVVDDGLDFNHKDIKDNIYTNLAELNGVAGVDDDNNGYIDDINGWNVVDNDNVADDHPLANGSVFSHGTQVAGVICATGNNQSGISGAAPLAKVLPIRCVSSTATLADAGFIYNGYEGVAYAIAAGADIINLSWGGPRHTVDMLGSIPHMVIQEAQARGILVAVASGNGKAFPASCLDAGRKDIQTMSYFNSPSDFGSGPHKIFPASFTEVISVGSVTSRNNQKSCFSDYGVFAGTDILAPGEAILTLSPNNEFKYVTGTSFSSPLVAAALAVLKSHFPSKTSAELRALLLDGAEDISYENDAIKNDIGAGLLNCDRSLNELGFSSQIAVTSNAVGCKTDVFSFEAKSFPGVDYEWNFGDGTLAVVGGNTITHTFSPVHDYSKYVRFTVSLKIKDASTGVILFENSRINAVQLKDCSAGSDNEWIFSSAVGLDFTNGVAQPLDVQATNPRLAISSVVNTTTYYNSTNSLKYSVYKSAGSNVEIKSSSLLTSTPTVLGSSTAKNCAVSVDNGGPEKLIITPNLINGLSGGAGMYYSVYEDYSPGGGIDGLRIKSGTKNTALAGPVAYAHNADNALETDGLVGVVNGCANNKWVIVKGKPFTISADKLFFYEVDMSGTNPSITYDHFEDCNAININEQVEISADGNFLAMYSNIDRIIEVYKLDQCAGIITFQKSLNMNFIGAIYDLEFLDDNSRILISDEAGSGIINFRLDDPVSLYKRLYFDMYSQGVTYAERGPDGHIYTNHNSEMMPDDYIGCLANTHTTYDQEPYDYNPTSIELDLSYGWSSSESGFYETYQSIDASNDYVIHVDPLGCDSIAVSLNIANGTATWEFLENGFVDVTSTDAEPHFGFKSQNKQGLVRVTIGATVIEEYVNGTFLPQLTFNNKSNYICDTADIHCYSIGMQAVPADVYRKTWTVDGGHVFRNEAFDTAVLVRWNSGHDMGTVKCVVKDYRSGCTDSITSTVYVNKSISISHFGSSTQIARNSALDLIADVQTNATFNTLVSWYYNDILVQGPLLPTVLLYQETTIQCSLIRAVWILLTLLQLLISALVLLTLVIR